MGSPITTGRLRALDVLAVGLVVLAGLINLSMPFHGDQALFAAYAERMRDGAVLYRDVWDIKQPGILGFYYTAGTLFGFHEEGTHLFELLCFAVFSLMLCAALKGSLRHPALTCVVPLLITGMYYAVAGSWHMTQVEGLAGIPMFLCIWSASRAVDGRMKHAFLSGLMGGVVLLLKFMFLPMLAAFWIVALIAAIRNRQASVPATLASAVLPVVVGLLVVVLPVAGVFAWLGQLGELRYTFFELPPRLVAELPNTGYGMLVHGLSWFGSRYAVLLALGFVGAFLALRERRDPLTVNLVLWVVLGFGVLLIQRRSWWAYQYLLLSVPLGILALRGIDLLWLHLKTGTLGDGRTKRVVLGGGLALLFLPALGLLADKALHLALNRFARTPETRREFQFHFNPDYRSATAEVAFLAEPDSRPGPIFVFGNPIHYTLSGRQQATAQHGWSSELLLPDQWARLRAELAAARPAYIFLDSFNRDLIPTRSPETAQFLAERYRVLRRGNGGTWYVLEP